MEAASRLRRAGVDEALYNARQLMLHVSGRSPAWLVAEGRAPLAEKDRNAFLAAIARRADREPLQHIIGQTGFYGLDILTDRRALIPRPDSECVVSAALDRLPEEQVCLVADLGTGSGCLLAAILSQRPLAGGIGVDASAAACDLALENLQALGLSGRAEIVTMRWTEWQGWSRADLVISNPPYIPSGMLAGLDPEVRDHDPVLALEGGSDGLSAYREITGLAGRLMRPGAWLIMETGFDQRQPVSQLLADSGFDSLAWGRDLAGHDRWVAGRKPA